MSASDWLSSGRSWSLNGCRSLLSVSNTREACESDEAMVATLSLA